MCINPSTKFSIMVQKGHEKYAINAEVKVILEAEDDFPILIGREGFFEEFKITFDEHGKKVILKKH